MANWVRAVVTGLVVVPLIVLLVITVLPGRAGEQVDDITWMVYDGEHQEPVRECVKDLPETVDGRPNDMPSEVDVFGVSVDTTLIDDARTSYVVSGTLRLSYATGDDDYAWECDVSQRWFQLKVTGLQYEIVE